MNEHSTIAKVPVVALVASMATVGTAYGELYTDEDLKGTSYFPASYQVEESNAFESFTFLPASEEYKDLKSQIAGFLDLQNGWDGYDGVAPSASAIESAMSFLSLLEIQMAPSPVPMLSGDGEVGLYWDRSGIFLDVGFEEGGLLSFFAEGPDIGKVGMDDVEFQRGIPSELAQILSKIKQG